ncbi:DUF2218 domain-containing protein [Phycicoccus sonneratiae]|uniref:DUF2218 domain-containing protein n=1 Tax=Phycicoccus sonneratiae TaxID=2807628 RepID=A0ABS2CG07_9MICO|nr:DUF2218 domain-containing protein [Phycicoccus sonneraticus]MBM6398810.1 DUF2218 domain-containing protein [Phycicoccus sonneraticus]
MVSGVIRTPRAERYVKQLAGHWREKAEVTVDADGATHFAMGSGASATLRPQPDVLVVESSTAEFGEVVQRHLERFGMREGLALEWEPEGQ